MKNVMPLLLLCLALAACKTNPFTGKKTLNFYGNSQIFPMAFAQYDQFLEENTVLEDTEEARKVARVGRRIAAAAERWLDANGYPGYLKEYQWDYNLVKDSTVNAWCMPGGKIVFYSGIMPICQNETGMAVVMGHEVAHALADHGAQRMSAGTLQQIGAVGVGVAVNDPEKRNAFLQAYGLGTTLGGMLPFSRSHETEADRIGLQIMAIAGYNPDEAAELWKRMKAQGGQAPPEFLSTHPSNDTRIANLTAWAPAAKEEARKFGVTTFE
ncbi:M48 family metallopeptidase [Robiginitalea sp. M366]|uniref:M48 family metallopeptidase n=1 Tax=Robiginitalea aestuariiviva TaxID=3036903 RepID=UPI00240E07F5|nr:M48 family metallopeptidase [Robiginitalea aestuariiviva]MDG1572592.1 M48 family metallopeptidase [Robiginitalea aestuariiviva]